MPTGFSSLLDFKSLSLPQIEKIFSLAHSLNESPLKPRLNGESLGLVFMENSTRTRLSFERAAHRAGVGTLLFEVGQKTSMEKGESIEDSIFNIASMKPAMMIIRCGPSVDLQAVAQQIQIPILNAGWGVSSHPTQALLDLFTLKSKWGKVAGKKLLILGDVKHSRVAASHLELSQIYGYELGQCGPQDYLHESSQFQRFASLHKGLSWCDAVMALRFQFERHVSSPQVFSKQDYAAQFGLSTLSMNHLAKNAPLLHPGPVNYGVEIEQIVTRDPRSCILEQVANGVVIREALIRLVLGETP